jgi:hypothetical protein
MLIQEILFHALCFLFNFYSKIQRTKVKHVCRLWAPRKYWMWKYARCGEVRMLFFVWLVFELPHIVRADLGFWMCERVRIKRCLYFSIDQCVGKLVGENESLLFLTYYRDMLFTWNEFDTRWKILYELLTFFLSHVLKNWVD